jgi:hypothetical protein
MTKGKRRIHIVISLYCIQEKGLESQGKAMAAMFDRVRPNVCFGSPQMMIDPMDG